MKQLKRYFPLVTDSFFVICAAFLHLEASHYVYLIGVFYYP